MRFDAYIVTGSRDWTARATIERVLTDACPGLIISGGARGADMMALEWARLKVALKRLERRYGKILYVAHTNRPTRYIVGLK